jgi:hypothetical protein
MDFKQNFSHKKRDGWHLQSAIKAGKSKRKMGLKRVNAGAILGMKGIAGANAPAMLLHMMAL